MLQKVYEVTRNGMRVGVVTVKQQGLYYQFACQCRNMGSQMVELMLEGEGWSQCLGLLCPQGGDLELTRRLPKRETGQGNWHFFLRQRLPWGQFVPLDPSKPIPYLKLITRSRFAVRSGVIGLILPEKK